MIPQLSQTFGPYEILGELGGGGMGVVFRAWDSRLQRQVAIKVLHQEHEIGGMREQFLLEARAASAWNHSNICTIFGIGEQDGEPYLVMELLEGETLKEKRSRRRSPVGRCRSMNWSAMRERLPRRWRVHMGRALFIGT